MASRKIELAIQRLVEIDAQIEELQKRRTATREAIADYLEAKDMKSYECNVTFPDAQGINRNARYRVTRSEAMTVDYDVEALKEKLDKEVTDIFIDKYYQLTDVEKLKGYFRLMGLKPSDFKKCVASIDVVNIRKLEQLFNIGELTAKDIKGCYKARITKRLSIKKVDKKNEDE